MSKRSISVFYVLKRDFIFLLMPFFLARNGSLKKTNIAIQQIKARTPVGRYCTKHPASTVLISRVFGSVEESFFFPCACLSFVSKS